MTLFIKYGVCTKTRHFPLYKWNISVSLNLLTNIIIPDCRARGGVPCVCFKLHLAILILKKKNREKEEK
jgi:hypothetical protein